MIINCSKQTDGRIDLSFPYNPELLKEIKKLNYRKWNPEHKTWTVLPDGLSFLMSVFQNYEFNCNFTLEDTKPRIQLTSDMKIDRENLPFIDNKSYQRLTYIGNPAGIYRVQQLLKEYGYDYDLPKEVVGREKTVELKPQGFELYPYQKECVEYGRKKDFSYICSLDIGLGKTYTALMSFYESDSKNLLIVCPSPLVEQWAEVLKENFNVEPTIVNTKIKKEKRKKLLEEDALVITSFDILWRENNANIQVDMLIIDEASKIKNYKTARAKALQKVIAKRRITLTGSPIENKLNELYAISDNTIPAFYGSIGMFYEKYTQEKGGRILPLEELYHKSKDLIFRKTKQDVKEQLPEKVMMELYCDLTPEEKKCGNIIKALDKEAIGKLAMLKVWTSNPNIYLKNDKLSSKEKLLEDLLIDELSDKKTVVFTQYKKNIPRFKKIATDNGIKALYLSGDNSKEIKEIRDKFINEDYQVLFMTQVSEYGMDKLQIASHLINMDLPYNPAQLEQRIGRIFRLGSSHESILIINLLSRNTLDKYLINILNNKSELSSLTLKNIKEHIIDDMGLRNE